MCIRDSLDIEPYIVARFVAPLGLLATCEWLTLDLAARQSEFERGIKEMFPGHGLEGVRLLEVELEMLGTESLKNGEPAPPLVVSTQEDMQRTFDGVWARVLEKQAAEKEAEEKAREGGPQPLQPAEYAELEARARERARGLLEKQVGVCPPPPRTVIYGPTALNLDRARLHHEYLARMGRSTR